MSSYHCIAIVMFLQGVDQHAFIKTNNRPAATTNHLSLHSLHFPSGYKIHNCDRGQSCVRALVTLIYDIMYWP